MLVICEECSKKYNVDESKVQGPKARFTCHKCGHIIVVRKTLAPQQEVFAPDVLANVAE